MKGKSLTFWDNNGNLGKTINLDITPHTDTPTRMKKQSELSFVGVLHNYAKISIPTSFLQEKPVHIRSI